jgi:hypothetical protein
MSIKLTEILPMQNLSDYKMHLARWNGKHQPLDVFVRSKEDWEGWQKYWGRRNPFNRKFIFALIDFYPERDIWLFGGIFEVIARNAHRNEVKLQESSKELTGRLKIRFKSPGRVRAVKLEKYYNELIVSEILKECYTGEEFCGYENINHDFRSIENIIKTNKPDWKAALMNIKGVYLITDTSNGRRYVGSAYGDWGIWSRWSCYVSTGHGWNDELRKLIKQGGIEYARSNFVFALLEYRSMRADDKIIIERENYWKEVLLTREPKYGYNEN